jgi:NAD(P)-dependent dehydrogenase (short-subunit alcohol dehydrogenase family)
MRALVVGGASGIGAALVARHRADGVPVVVWDVTGERDVTCDISEPDAVDRAMNETLDAGPAPDLICVCAGIGHAGMLTEATARDWDHVMGVNAKGPWLVMRAAANALIPTGAPGSIVATTSVSAHLVDRNMGLYCASKAALTMIVKVAAAEWAASGIRVNAVAPGVTDTPMLGGTPPGTSWLGPIESRTPLGRLGEPAEVADAIVALHGLGWVTGQVLDADGGLGLTSPIDSYGWAQNLRAP